MFYPWCFFLFRQSSSELPRPIALKLCHVIRTWLNFIIPLQKLGGAPPKKIGGQKHAKFRSILDHFRLWPRISPERGNVSKIGKMYELVKFLLRFWKKSGELWSTNGLELHVSLDPLKCTFLAYCISALKGRCALKFLHALEIDQDYLAHTPPGAGVPPKNFNREH